MIETKTKIREYYKTGKYKGFYLDKEQNKKLTGTTIVTFSNGKKKMRASGIFKEAALEKVFDMIDKSIAN